MDQFQNNRNGKKVLREILPWQGNQREELVHSAYLELHYVLWVSNVCVTLTAVPRNYDPALHPFEVPREYTRALNATKLERVFAKPFLSSLDGHRDGVNCMAKHPKSLSTVLSGACDGEVSCSYKPQQMRYLSSVFSFFFLYFLFSFSFFLFNAPCLPFFCVFVQHDTLSSLRRCNLPSLEQCFSKCRL